LKGQELAQQQEERKTQLELIKSLMEGSTSTIKQSPNTHFRNLTEADDIDIYLTTFERLVTLENLEEQH